ncbi:MAG: SusC/RagA family TonB-linked outer membrane protein [Prevotellaceae bacterium]|nr:SusC/RagA family TonB-linked outer membrane protein [Prevotellaceae bacterium]
MKIVEKITLLLVCFLMSAGLVFAQQTQVTGIVKENTGEPVVGASVVVKGTNVGILTDTNGQFSFDVPESATIIVVSYIGFKEKEVAVKPHIEVVMEPDVSALDEVIVVAYGTAKKSSFTGSVATVKGENLTKKNQSEITKALVGEAAGVQVLTSSGQPGTNATVRIRGFGSANSKRNPLYVVDGLPFDGDISAIDAADVESTTILKDASASALYGARAANGVILITTKKGVKGQSNIEVDLKAGVNIRLIPLYDVIDSPERYAELSWEALRNYGVLQNRLSPVAAAVFASNNLFDTSLGISPVYNMWNTGANTVIDPVTGKFSGAGRKYTPEKWSDHMFNTGKKTEASVRFSGGADKLSYYTSFGYLNEKGYYIGSDFSRLSARSNLNYQPREWLKASTNLSYSYMEFRNPSQTDNQNNGFQFVNNMPPVYPVFQRDADGKLIPDPVVGGNRYDFGMGPGYERGYASGINPVGTFKLDNKNQISHQLIGNVNFEISFLKDFKLISSNGYQFLYLASTDLVNPYYGDAEGLGRISREHVSYLGLTNTQMLSYKKLIADKHTINAFVAHESSLLVIRDDYAEKFKMAKADNVEFNNAINMQNIAGYKLDKSIESFFAEIKYDYDEKYFVSLDFRRDGSSRFTNHRWGNFGSAGLAWAINKESFMDDLDFVDHFRLKASYGSFGNEDLDLGSTNADFYPTQNLYNIRNLNDQISYSLYYIGNSDLTWEKSSMFNTGLDFELWNGRLNGEIEFFQKRTTNMIFNKQVAPSLGYAAAPVNDAELHNTGIEFNFSGKVVKTSDWEVELRVNGAHYTNKMKRMPMEGAKEKNLEMHSAYGWSKGHSIYDFYLREYAGVDPNTGQSQWFVYYDNNNLNESGKATRISNMTEYFNQRAEANETVELDEQKTYNYAEATLKYSGKSAIPDITGSFGFNVKYKGIELSALFIYGVGGYGYDYVYAGLMNNDRVGTMNWHRDIEQRWTAPGQQTSVPRLSATYDEYVNSSSSRFLTSMSYLGLNNIRLSYTFPKRLLNKIKINKTSIWVSGDNLYMSSARAGYFPIGNQAGESNRSQYVPLSTIMCGINVQF